MLALLRFSNQPGLAHHTGYLITTTRRTAMSGRRSSIKTHIRGEQTSTYSRENYENTAREDITENAELLSFDGEGKEETIEFWMDYLIGHDYRIHLFAKDALFILIAQRMIEKGYFTTANVIREYERTDGYNTEEVWDELFIIEYNEEAKEFQVLTKSKIILQFDYNDLGNILSDQGKKLLAAESGDAILYHDHSEKTSISIPCFKKIVVTPEDVYVREDF
jgi:hypothetical protein